MPKKNISEHTLGPKALEMVMRDVLGGMEELAIMKSYETSSDVFEVISIDPLVEAEKESQEKLDKPAKKEEGSKADIIPIEKFRAQTDGKE